MDHEIGLRFVEGRFLEAYRRGDMILLDEVNLANEEMLGVLYQMLTLGYLEHNGKIIKPEGIMPKVIATAKSVQLFRPQPDERSVHEPF